MTTTFACLIAYFSNPRTTLRPHHFMHYHPVLRCTTTQLTHNEEITQHIFAIFVLSYVCLSRCNLFLFSIWKLRRGRSRPANNRTKKKQETKEQRKQQKNDRERERIHARKTASLHEISFEHDDLMTNTKNIKENWKGIHLLRLLRCRSANICMKNWKEKYAKCRRQQRRRRQQTANCAWDAGARAASESELFAKQLCASSKVIVRSRSSDAECVLFRCWEENNISMCFWVALAPNVKCKSMRRECKKN